MAQEDKKETKQFISNISLPTSFVDNLLITSRKDGLYLLRFLNALPEGVKEESRLIVPRARLCEMLEVLCRHLDYYPDPREKGKKGRSN